MTKVTIWCIEFCRSSLGVYDYQWFATEDEAKAAIKEAVEEEGYKAVSDSTGYDMTMLEEPIPIEVELTLEGLLAFANTHAVDTGAC